MPPSHAKRARSKLAIGMTASPSGTASAPPSQKSFCRSTSTSPTLRRFTGCGAASAAASTAAAAAAAASLEAGQEPAPSAAAAAAAPSAAPRGDVAAVSEPALALFAPPASKESGGRGAASREEGLTLPPLLTRPCPAPPPGSFPQLSPRSRPSARPCTSITRPPAAASAGDAAAVPFARGAPAGLDMASPREEMASPKVEKGRGTVYWLSRTGWMV